MAGTSLFKKSILAVLAASVALGSVPAMAQERGGWGGRGRAMSDEGSQRPDRAARSEQFRSAAPQRTWSESRPQQAQGEGPRGWRGDGRGERAGGWQRPESGQRGDWQRRGAPSAQVPAEQARSGWRPRERDGTSAWSGDRNRSYANPDRNGSYRQGYRDGVRRDNRDDRRDVREAWRDGYRDGVRRDNRNDRRWSNDSRRYGWGGNGAYNGWNSGRDYRRWDNNWRRDRRYDWYGWRNQHRDVFRAGRYYAPFSGYRYSRLSIGFFLDSGFYGSRYWISNPWSYRLPDVYGPYRWVRYYDDALLVDTFTGEVVDVIYDMFW